MTPAEPSKRCITCGETKPFHAFSRNASYTNGREGACKECRKIANRHYARNESPERKEYRRLCIEQNRERVNEKERERYAANREKQRARARRYHHTHPEVVKAKSRRWKEANPEKVREAARRFRAKRRRALGARACKQLALFPAKTRSQQSARRWKQRLKNAAGYGYTTRALLQARWDLYGGRCYYCGSDAREFDHRIPLSRGGTHWPANLVPACLPCNRSKNAKTEREFAAMRSTAA